MIIYYLHVQYNLITTRQSFFLIVTQLALGDGQSFVDIL